MKIHIEQPSDDLTIFIDSKQVYPPVYPLNWKLTLPVDATGGNTGIAAEVLPLMSDYQYLPYFSQGGDGMLFIAPVDGATTKGSKYPRCELRELNADGTLAAWSVNDGKRHVLSANCVIDERPVTSDGKVGRVTIAQIHGRNEELCGLQSDGTFYDDHGDTVTGRMKRFPLKSVTGASLVLTNGVPFSYVIEVKDGKLNVSVAVNGTVYSNVDPIAAVWATDVFYFKAGSYSQVGKNPDATTGTGRAVVTHRNVRVTHA